MVSSEEVYRKTTEATINMNKSIFNENQRSYYTDNDIKILRGCRTIVPCGIMKKSEA